MFYLVGLRLLKYITFRAAYATVFAFLLALIVGPFIILRLKKLKLDQILREDGPKRHLNEKVGVPTMGGILIFFCVLVSLFFWIHPSNVYFLIMTFVMLSFACLGFMDDFLKIKRKNSDGLHPWIKVYGQILFSFISVSMLYYFGSEHVSVIYFPFIKSFKLDLGFLYIPFGMFVLISASNSFNLTDGLDGLAIGLSIVVTGALVIIAYLTSRADFASYLDIPNVKGSEELVIFLGALLGGSFGFLWFNAYPAKIMMGDTGSLSIGAILGMVALILKSEILFAILAGVFVIETLSVIIQVAVYRRTKRRVFRMAPLHHHFEELGWSEMQVVIRFWIMGLIFAIIALSTLKIR
ncbi:phospho-N-acetylmuramoyl-pentapeptide-transferase [Candidatus Borreliella tachyglossi]|uniref:Phospho-N-acetylmuramoyl-pentapeptide-transferase n=1 Tax=Candidatus Borreliella tachyglossi TaxID=1964448 RepID=A0A2S1LWN9_9SPIR|nr:phospho-N-acetylmuramoyl-pentapeptide-transferase [Candidatus Borreliella tachyglossi]AWG42690.1 phospho-N-acetylmuramoyl-pentapeptide-transferase [Candidatus Borreliella tachyglossi]